MMERGYKVRLDAFEGPLDLLLHLVKTNEVDIYDLPIATITDQYVEYMGMFEELDLDVAGEYLVMAATLMYLKSRLLLPLDEDDEEEADDPAVDLIRQLAEYKRYREAAEELRDRSLVDRDVFRRSPSMPEGVEPLDGGLARVELADLFESLRRVLTRASSRRPHLIEPEHYSTADAVRAMVGKLRSRGQLSFEGLFEESSARGFMIATFVGLLELMKMGIIEAVQEEHGESIVLSLSDRKFDESLLALVETYGQGGTAVGLGAVTEWQGEGGGGEDGPH